MGTNKRIIRKYRLSVAYDTKENHESKSQPGGTAMINTQNMVLHARDTGIDQRKLGRWT